MFETIEGGFLDIDVRIVGPDGKVIYQVRKIEKICNFHRMISRFF